MKLKNIFAVAIASVALFSCSTEVNNGVDPVEEGTSRIKLDLKIEGVETRAGHYGTNASEDELKIYNYAVFIFKSNGILEAALTASPFHSGNLTAKDYNNTPLTFTPGAGNPTMNDDGTITLSAGTKMFFTIVNAPKDLLEEQEQYLQENSLSRNSLTGIELSFDDLTKIVGSYDNRTDGGVVYFENDITDSTDDNTPNRGFMMTTTATNGFEEHNLPESDIVTTVELNVGRAMAKVSLGSNLSGVAGDGGTEPNGTLDVYGYKIINNPNKMYVLPHAEGGVVLAPYYYTTANDLNVNNYFESHNSADYTSETPSLDGNYIPVSTDAHKSFTYCIENANLTPRQGTTTIALIKGKFNPGGNANVYDNVIDRNLDAPLASDGTFYRIWIKQFTDSDGAVKGERYDGENYYYTEAPSPAALDAYKAVLATDNGWNANAVELEVHTFDEGICYYRLPLYNDNYSIAPYTVKRNSYYMIDIESVQGAGLPDEDTGIKPIDPIEPQTTIEVTIKVNDWEAVTQPGHL